MKHIAIVLATLVASSAFAEDFKIESSVPNGYLIDVHRIDHEMDEVFSIDRYGMVHGSLDPVHAAGLYHVESATAPLNCGEYDSAVLFQVDDTVLHKSWKIDIKADGRVYYSGPDYVSPKLAEFINALAENVKCRG